MKYFEKLKVEYVDINILLDAEYNPRAMTEKEALDLANSMDEFDIVEPLVVNNAPERMNIIIGGHRRKDIAKAKGYKEVPVVYINIPDIEKERELNLRLNKNVGHWDWGQLANFDPAMLMGVGFDPNELDLHFDVTTKEDDFDVEKEYEKIETPVSQYGDVYQLGSHRLMCGDATKVEDVEKLMAGNKADLIYTDPPYNVNYTSQGGNSYSEGKYKGKKIFNDNKGDDEFVAFLTHALTNAFNFSHEHANIYCWFAMTNYRLFRASLENAGFKYMQTCIWLKEHMIFSMGWYFHRVYEPVMVGYKNWKTKYTNKKYSKERDIWDLDRVEFEQRLNVWYVERDNTNKYEHPTQKPVRLPERALRRTSERGHIVLDLFGGSGSTMLCAEQLGRVCYSMELDPKYCDVIVGRYERFTGGKAVKL